MTFKKPVLLLRRENAEAATDHELCYYYYITMEELVNPETDNKACTIGLYDSCVIRTWFNRGLSF